MQLKKQKHKSIRRQLLQWLLLPLCTLWLITSTVDYFLALKFANDAYDRELLNSVDSVVARIKEKDGNIVVDLPPAAQAILRQNNKDKFYYHVISDSGKKLSGDAIIPLPKNDLKPGEHEFRTEGTGAQRLRIASLGVAATTSNEHLIVQVAETLINRKDFADQIVVAMLIPQMMLITLGALAVSFGITRGLAGIRDIQAAVSSRSQHDLRPVDQNDAPIEIQPLVLSINQLLQRLRDDIDSQRRFVANAAHQLRTPLAGLKTYLAIARRSSDDGSSVEALRQLDTGMNRITHMVDRLLSLARVEPNGRGIDSHTKIDLNAIASEATAQFADISIEKNIDLSLECSADAAYISGDWDSLLEMTTNLVENALLYTHEGGKVSVGVDTRPRPSLYVEDSGPGIPEEERGRVFERFYRVLGNEAPGSGLGLAIVKEIARLHEAAIAVESVQTGQGVRFVIRFPEIVPEWQPAEQVRPIR